MPIVKGKKALLIAEGCKLNKERKLLEKRLNEIKVELSFKKDGNYNNEAGDVLQIAKTEKFTEIEPKRLYTYLKKLNKSHSFFRVVKVQLTELKKVIPETAINKMREELDPTLRWSWK